MKKCIIIIMIICFVFMGCKTIDLEENRFEELQSEKEQLEKDNKNLLEAIDSLYMIEKDEYIVDIEPVIIPYKETIILNEDGREVDDEGLSDLEAIKDANKDTVVSLKNLNGGMSIYDYDNERQTPIWTKQLAMTTIILEPGEEVLSTPYLSDTLRWEISGDLWIDNGLDVQLIMIKPLEANLETNMLIITNKRLYHFVLYSTKNDYQPMVTFRYPLSTKFISAQTKREDVEINKSVTQVNDEYLSFNYKVRYLWNVDWIPTLIYDDGEKTYIELPDGVLQKELPVVHENKDDIVNYRVSHNIMIIDKLCEKLTISIGNRSVTIEKKKGESFAN